MLINKLLENGYLEIENFYTPDDIKKMRDLCLSEKFPKKGSVINGDLITYKVFREIIFNDKLISFVKKILGDNIIYICDGSARGDDKALLKKSRKYHSDSRADDFDFTKEYPIYRFGIYLQDTEQFSGGLKIRPKSHLRLCIDHGTWLNGLYRFIKYFQFYKKIPPITVSAGKNLKTKRGDLLVWNMRLHHSGYAVRLKWLPNLALYPFIENWIPDSWKMIGNDKRCVAFFAFSKKSNYLDNFYFYNHSHPDNKEHFEYSDFSQPDLLEFLDKNKITLSTNYIQDSFDEKKKIYDSRKFF